MRTLARLFDRFGTTRTSDPGDHAGQRMVILVNSNVKMSRGKFAAQAVHAALILRGVHHGGPVIVLGGKPAEIEAMPTVVHDAGRTELEPGTLTAGARWETAK